MRISDWSSDVCSSDLKKTSLKSVFQDVLLEMHDPDWSTGTEKVLRVRIDEFVRRLGVELLVVDEIQHLRRAGNDVNDVTDALTRWLDAGSVALVLVRNMESDGGRAGREWVSTCRSRGS